MLDRDLERYGHFHRVFMEATCEVHDEIKEFQWTIRLK